MSKKNGPRPAHTYRAVRRNLAKDRRYLMRDEGAKRVTFAAVWAPLGAKTKTEKVSRKRLNPSKHPGANPLHNPAGRERGTINVPNPAGGVTEVSYLGPRNPSRWVPHQGKREKARRIGAL